MMDNMLVVNYTSKKDNAKVRFFEDTCQGIDDAFELAKERLKNKMDREYSYVSIEYYKPPSEYEEE